MSTYQVNYQRRDIEGQIVKGSVVYRAHHQGLAIDYAAQELTADDDTASFVITSVKAVSR